MTETKQWRDHKGIALDSANGFDVIECERCEFKHIIPIPSPRELEAVYTREYYSAEKPLYIKEFQEDVDWWNIVYGERYDSFETLMPHDSRRILDVGSGPGYFLLQGRERGWDTLGIEPSAQAAAHSRGLGLMIVEGFLTQSTAKDLGTFDVVHMSEVLEHIPAPEEMLHIVHTLLAPGGLIWVVVPNDYNPIQMILRSVCDYSPWWVSPPHHINYFDFDSLEQLLMNSGFEVLLREATFPIDMFLLMGEDYVGNDELGRRCHTKRKLLELKVSEAGGTDMKRRLYQELASLGIGREVQVIAKKK